MKSKHVVYAILSLIIVLVIVFISINKSNSSTSDLSGTIGKVEKYRKVQLTEEDIKLRNDLMTDTSQISNSIKGLLLFNDFCITFTKNNNEIRQQMKYNYSPEFNKTLAFLDSYSNFIKENTKTVEDALLFLFDVYNGDTTEASVNTTPKLKKFNAFVSELLSKDSLLTNVLFEFDKEFKGLKNSKVPKEVISELVNAKERFAINALPLSIILGNANMGTILWNTTISNAENLKYYFAGKPSLQAGFTAKPLGKIVFTGIELEALKMIYSKNNGLNFIYISNSSKDLQAINNSQTTLQYGPVEMARMISSGTAVYAAFNHLEGLIIIRSSELNGKSLSGLLSNNTTSLALYSKMQAKLGAW